MATSTKPFRILTLDGGGIHGVIPATILAHVEAQAGAPVADLFDLVVGTSTGGILALGLTVPDASGRPKFSAGDLQALYCRDAGEIFKPWDASDLAARAEDAVAQRLVDLNVIDAQHKSALEGGSGKPVPWWRGLFHPKYTASGLEGFLQTHFGDAPLSAPVAGTFAAVNSFDIDDYGLKVFRSWEASAAPADDFAMWAAARATSAAPTYFPAAGITSRDGTTTFHGIDGGVAVDDPVLVGYTEGRRLQGRLSGEAGRSPILIVSIGTGAPPDQSIRYADVKDAGILGWFLHGLMDVLIEGANAAANQLAEQLLPAGSFYRFQAPLSGPGYDVGPGIDDWSAGNIEALQKAAAYLIDKETATLGTVIAKLKEGGPAIA